MGWTTKWFSEIDPYASAVLAKHWPGVVNHGDITKIDFTTVEPVDLLCGGFPCQDISNAGKRAGISGERSGLWRQYARAVRELRPEWVVIENVGALLGRGFDVVRGDLRATGYRVARPVRMSAAAVGAPHPRERLWIVATASDNGSRRRLQFTVGGESPQHVADPNRQRLEGRKEATQPQEERGSHPGHHRTTTGGNGGDGWWITEPDVGRVAHGIPSRVDRLRGLGNAIVPQCAYVIFQAIQEAEERMRAA